MKIFYSHSIFQKKPLYYTLVESVKGFDFLFYLKNQNFEYSIFYVVLPAIQYLGNHWFILTSTSLILVILA